MKPAFLVVNLVATPTRASVSRCSQEPVAARRTKPTTIFRHSGPPLPTGAQTHDAYMQEAIDEAHCAYAALEVPIGAVLVCEHGQIIARGHNQVESQCDVSAHAELVCLRRAPAERARICPACRENQSGTARPASWRLTGCTLYCTLEPCSMCLSAALLARLSGIVYGAPDVRLGAAGSWIDLLRVKHPFHDSITVQGGVRRTQCAALMRSFFRMRRTMR
ncbi:tRNA-specific adenosine deaminase [Porphyridium purpureum]|uniref:tRNA(adenine(34)) deaminase n=1 Tax=Porphyridium purpureum TaxID=35688 RepID=A0A5J4YZP6_PORPP|nr:tRNA-specific adenosine deaminase [Porphyridium purpureum]|eukprot:POR1264..scf209_3